MSSYETLRSKADYKNFLENCQYDEVAFDGICADLFTLLKEKCKYYLDLVEEEAKYFEDTDSAPQMALAGELIMGLSEILTSSDYFDACAQEKPTFTKKKVLKTDSEEKRLHIERLAVLKEKIVKIYDKELSSVRSRAEELSAFLQSGKTATALTDYILRFDEKYKKKKIERNVLDYNDLEHKALELLNNPTVVEEVKEKYEYVFVDEYQDVNPVQEAIISKLSGNNLFLVGDVKQSIYGFRGSKSKFFVEKQRAFERGEGKALVMKRNFRSSDAVLDAVNKQFSLAMTLQTGDVDYKHDSYMERGGRYALNDGRVQIHFLGEQKKSKPPMRGVYSVKANTNKRETEESRLAQVIRHIIEQERASNFYDVETGEIRRVAYSDIAILSRKKQGQIAQTVASLSAEGIPVTTATSVNICDYAEVKTLIDILSLLDNKEQDVPFCSALLSSMGNLTVDDLATIRLAYKKEQFFRKATRKYAETFSDTISGKLKAFFAYFEKLRMLSRVMDAGELLTRILSETRMESGLLAKENGVACLKRIHRFIEESVTPEPLCVHEFLDRLRDLEYKIEYSENGGDDSVKVLTMHSSKGLEYPIVILDNLSMNFRGIDKDEVFIEEKYGLATRAFDVTNMTKTTTLLRRLYEKKEAQSSIADELNLYYVALTRAKYGLHMIFDAPTVVTDVRYATSFAEFTDFSVWRNYVVDDEIIALEKQERMPLPFKPEETLTQEIMRAFLWKYPFEAYQNLPVKSSATALLDGGEQAILQLGEDVQQTEIEAQTEENTTGVEEGIAYHAFLESFDFSLLYDENGENVDVETLRIHVEDALTDWRLRDEQTWSLLNIEKLVEILSNPVFYQLRDMRLYKEQQFLVELPIKDTYAKKENVPDDLKDSEEMMIFQGAIDLLAIGESEVRIIDYKYSKRTANGLQTHYRKQLELYRLAVSKILKVPKEQVRCSIVNIFKGFQVDIDEIV